MSAPMFTFVILLGVLLALPYVLRARTHRRPARAFAIGLVVATLVYVAFAAVAADARGLGLEAGGVFLFGLAAAAGLRLSPHLLAAAWVAHVGWDLWLHPVGDAGYAPWWYLALCVGFDLFVAGFIVATFTRRRAEP